ncbi:MAG: thioredoxin, partial [Pseudomonadota bacterium]
MSNSNDNPFGGQAGGYGNQSVAFDAAQAAPTPPAPAQGAKTAGAPGASAGGPLIKDTTTVNFSADVIEESRNQPVLIDFWAPWCGPCKQLTPILEAAVQKAGGTVKLVKMNIDEHPAIAGQMGVQSIPAVLAFVNGQPVDGFMGALPETQVAAFIDKIAGMANSGADPTAAMIEDGLTQAQAAIDAG